MITPRYLAAFLALASLMNNAALACPLATVSDANLPAVLRGHGARTASTPSAIVFQSKMARDYDGAPTAYHRGYSDDSPDPGLDHICNGADILELVNGRLINKYRQGGSIGSLGGIDPRTGISRSKLCKRDYIALRDLEFPRCGVGRLCLRFYGVAYEPRLCGYNRNDQDGCGIPILQKDSAGNELEYYLSRNTLIRPGASSISRTQSDYADATRIPFLVMPGGLQLPSGMRWQPGDLALVVARNGRMAFAVVGDSGPRDKLGEGSAALLRELQIGPTEQSDAVTTLLFPGTASRVVGSWPIDPQVFGQEVRTLLNEFPGGVAAVSRCPGMAGLR